MFKKIRATLTDDNEMPREWQRFASLLLLLLAFLMAMLPYEQSILFGAAHRSFNFRPGLVPSVLALVLIAPLYLRGLLKWNKSIFSSISFVLILGVFAAFLELALFGGKGVLGRINGYMVLLALALSWIGLRSVAGIAWMIVLAAGVYNALDVGIDLGISGFIFVCAAFMGLCFHSGVNPGELFSSLKEEYSPTAARIGKIVGEDISAAKAVYSKR